jgi:hypothetical protein
VYARPACCPVTEAVSLSPGLVLLNGYQVFIILANTARIIRQEARRSMCEKYWRLSVPSS